LILVGARQHQHERVRGQLREGREAFFRLQAHRVGAEDPSGQHQAKFLGDGLRRRRIADDLGDRVAMREDLSLFPARAHQISAEGRDQQTSEREHRKGEQRAPNDPPEARCQHVSRQQCSPGEFGFRDSVAAANLP